MTTGSGLQRIVPAAALACVVLAMVAGAASLRSAARQGDRFSERLATLEELQTEHARLNHLAERLSVRIAAGGGSGGIVGVVEGIFAAVDLSDSITAVTPGERETIPGGERRETVRIEARRLNLNGLVNILHRVESFPGALQARDVHVKTDFERPELLNVELELALILPAS